MRDCIPEIIENDGKQCICEVLSSEDYLTLLNEKFQEELSEYEESKSLEVLYAVVKTRGWSVEELEQVRNEKAEQRGGFEKRILHISTEISYHVSYNENKPKSGNWWTMYEKHNEGFSFS